MQLVALRHLYNPFRFNFCLCDLLRDTSSQTLQDHQGSDLTNLQAESLLLLLQGAHLSLNEANQSLIIWNQDKNSENKVTVIFMFLNGQYFVYIFASSSYDHLSMKLFLMKMFFIIYITVLFHSLYYSLGSLLMFYSYKHLRHNFIVLCTRARSRIHYSVTTSVHSDAVHIHVLQYFQERWTSSFTFYLLDQDSPKTHKCPHLKPTKRLLFVGYLCF